MNRERYKNILFVFTLFAIGIIFAGYHEYITQPNYPAIRMASKVKSIGFRLIDKDDTHRYYYTLENNFEFTSNDMYKVGDVLKVVKRNWSDPDFEITLINETAQDRLYRGFIPW